jgi:uncharacterized membrane protein YhaH (DUF805 family)
LDRVLRYLSFRGRANRQRYWLTSLALTGLIVVGLVFVQMLGVIGAVLGGVAFLGYAIALLALAVRRLHDRNKSGWWLLPMYLPAFLLTVLGQIAGVSSPEAQAGASLLSLPFSIWVFVELGCLRGTAGLNRFGPDPLTPELQEVFS